MQQSALPNFKPFPSFKIQLKPHALIYAQEGNLAYLYQAFRNVQASEDREDILKNLLIHIDTEELNFDINHPVDIEVLPSYDGTVNLILNDDLNPPRLINSRFTVKEGKKFSIIDRKGNNDTNVYKENYFDLLTRLFKNYNVIPFIEFEGLQEGGSLNTGVYSFYIKYTDADGNESDVIAESGVIPVHLGSVNDPHSISGGILSLPCDKIIKLKINNVDTSYDYINVYYSVSTGENSYNNLLRYYKILDKKIITSDSLDITITGLENTIEVNKDLVNVQYNIVDRVSTLAQVLNMLFFGNVNTPTIPYLEFEDIALRIHPRVINDINIGDLGDTYGPVDGNKEHIGYYNMQNVYKYTGYWNSEIYRFGIVFILKDDSLSPVFNVRGCNNLKDDTTFLNPPFWSNEEKTERNYIITSEDGFYNNPTLNLENTKGVVRLDFTGLIYLKVEDKDYNELKPLGIEFIIPDECLLRIKEYAKGFFFVRLKRIPTILAQGLTIGVDRESCLPCLKRNGKFFVESIMNKNRKLSNVFEDHLIEDEGLGIVNFNGILSPELINNKVISSGLFNNSDFVLSNSFIDNAGSELINNNRHLSIAGYTNRAPFEYLEKTKLINVGDNTHLKVIDDKKFSTVAGIAEEAFRFKQFVTLDRITKTTNVVRGMFTPFYGAELNLSSHKIVNIHIPGYNYSLMEEYFKIRFNSLSTFYAISNRYDLNKLDLYDNINKEEDTTNFTEYRGDCYINNVTVRMCRNFIDPETPINDDIIDAATWSDYYLADDDINKKKDKYKINRADVNAVQLGHWVTFKVFSNINLALRSLDNSDASEVALMGQPRGFYPALSLSTGSLSKIPESELYNAGFKNTVSYKQYTVLEDVPYIKNIFDNRVLFSTRHVNDAFQNGYRIFLGLAYQDITLQYGAIVKMYNWQDNIFVVFENGIALLAVNEKALILSETGLSIHMYGAGVLPLKETPISTDFGSRWKDSIIKTPVGIYGVDTEAKKIWRFSSNGFEILSDFKILKFLNEHLIMDADEYLQFATLRNVRTHYDNFKGDVIFTYYNCTRDNNYSFNLVFNERLGKWSTRTDWTPLFSSNINNIFISYNKDGIAKNIALNAYTDENGNLSDGIVLDNNKITETVGVVKIGKFNLKGYDYYKEYDQREYKLLPEAEALGYSVKDGELYLDLDVRNSESIADILTVTLSMKSNDAEAPDFVDTVIILTEDLLSSTYLYKHGLANLFNNTKEIKPSTWYDLPHKFEFEFVVCDKYLVLKIFNNLRIVSNQICPEKILITIPDDSYDGIINLDEISQWQKIIKIPRDNRLKGNTQYKENIWDILIRPLNKNQKLTRFRNKYAKFRIVYNTLDLALITLIQTLYTVSYA